MGAPRSMGTAPIGAVFKHTMTGLTGEEILHAVTILLTRETPSSFAVTSGENGHYDLRLSSNSHWYLTEWLAAERSDPLASVAVGDSTSGMTEFCGSDWDNDCCPAEFYTTSEYTGNRILLFCTRDQHPAHWPHIATGGGRVLAIDRSR